MPITERLQRQIQDTSGSIRRSMEGFYGLYPGHHVGSDGRIFIPNQFAKVLAGQEFIVAKWYENCLLIGPLNLGPSIKSHDIEFYQDTLDNKGRPSIKPNFMHHAQLFPGANLDFLGQDKYFEIWNEELFGLEKRKFPAESEVNEFVRRILES